jgi:hypothetical protein
MTHFDSIIQEPAPSAQPEWVGDAVKLDRVTETADGAPIEWRVAYARKTA